MTDAHRHSSTHPKYDVIMLENFPFKEGEQENNRAKFLNCAGIRRKANC